jgi:hypothetical protein
MNAPLKSAPTDFVDDDRAPRHSWGEPMRFQHKTERECRRCGMVKVTRHQTFENVWTEFWRNGEEKIEGKGTPVCTGRKT